MTDIDSPQDIRATVAAAQREHIARLDRMAGWITDPHQQAGGAVIAAHNALLTEAQEAERLQLLALDLEADRDRLRARVAQLEQALHEVANLAAVTRPNYDPAGTLGDIVRCAQLAIRGSGRATATDDASMAAVMAAHEEDADQLRARVTYLENEVSETARCAAELERALTDTRQQLRAEAKHIMRRPADPPTAPDTAWWLRRLAERPVCSGPSRRTTNMVCQSCGKDWGVSSTPPAGTSGCAHHDQRCEVPTALCIVDCPPAGTEADHG